MSSGGCHMPVGTTRFQWGGTTPPHAASSAVIVHWRRACLSRMCMCMLCRKQLAANLWRRADQEGARTQMERRNFGIADDVFAAGLLLAYMAFMPFCAPGSIDAPSLQR